MSTVHHSVDATEMFPASVADPRAAMASALVHVRSPTSRPDRRFTPQPQRQQDQSDTEVA